MSIKIDAVKDLMCEKGSLVEPSFCPVAGGYLSLLDTDGGRKIAVAAREGSAAQSGWHGAEFEPTGVKRMQLGVFPLNSNNAALVRRMVPWAAPTSCGTKGLSVGLCDYLGEAPQDLPLMFAGKMLKPVLVEFTPEKSSALGRNFLQAMDSAVWNVMASGAHESWGANAAGLKTEEEIVKALLYGYSGIGLDIAPKIDLLADEKTDEEIEKTFAALDTDFRDAIEKSYLGAEFKVGDAKVSFNKEEVHRIVLKLGQAVMFTQKIYGDYLRDTPWDIDFEVDISGCQKPLTPGEHYFLANELKRAAVKFDSLCVDASLAEACGEDELKTHAGIAKAFDYRLSLAGADIKVKDPAAVAEAFGRRIHFRLENLLYLAALETAAAKDPALTEKIADLAKLPEDKTKDPEVFAASYAKVLGEGGVAEELKALLAREKELYAQKTRELLDRFLAKI